MTVDHKAKQRQALEFMRPPYLQPCPSPGATMLVLVLLREQNSYEVVILTSHKGSLRISGMVGRGDRKNKREKEETPSGQGP